MQLRIEDLEDPSPFLASIRWRKDGASARPRLGLGLQFLGIRPGQIQELTARFLGLQPGAGGARAGSA